MPISPLVLIDPRLGGTTVVLGSLGFIAIEYGVNRLIGRDPYDARETAAAMGLAIGRLLLRGVGAVLITGPFLFVWQHRLFTFNQTAPLALLCLFLGAEFIYYWHHRLSHHLRWMWATHSVHHSTTKLNLTAALRLGLTGTLSGNQWFFLPLIWIGFHPFLVTAVIGLNLFYQFFIHTELIPRLGPLEWIFNTPAHHRVHHATNDACLDRNFGGVLIIFDRLFGTFAKIPAGDALRYGIAGARPEFNPLRIAFGEWFAIARDVWSAPSAEQKLTALVRVPVASSRPADGRQPLPIAIRVRPSSFSIGD
ncbi:MAG: sterol desaturase family protein [Methylovirgula sp.]